MAKRKSAAPSKRAHSSIKITAKGKRTRPAVVRSSKDTGKSFPIAQVPAVQPVRSVVTANVSEKPGPPEDHDSSKPEVDFLSPIVIIRAFQTKLLEIVQANLQFSFELAQRVARVRTPNELMCINAEFTKSRMEMFLKHSKDLTTF
jgi:hypothetical protein